ncbi:MAG: TolC family protein [Candidatus Methylomirabilia bacterium]
MILGIGASRSHAISLGEGLALISRSGREIAVSGAEAEVLRSGLILAGSAWKPTVDAYARETLLAYQPQSVAGVQTFPVADRDSFALGVKVRQLLFDFGRTDATVRAAALDLEAKQLETALVRNRSALRFILTYIGLLRAEKLLALQEQEVARFEAHRNDTRSLLEEGTITENDLLQAEVRLSDAVQRRLQAENLRSLAAAQTNSLLQRPLALPVAPQEISGPVEVGAERNLDEALATAALERSEFAGIRKRLDAVEARRTAVRKEYYPKLYVAGGYDFSQNEYTVHEGNWSLQAGLDFNIFAGGVTGEKLRQKERELFLIERTREQLLDAVQLEVQEGFLALQTARSRVGATELAVAQAQENLRLQRLRYGEGVGTATEVLDAVSLATTAEQNFLNARYDVTAARARLGFAVGIDLVAAWGGGERQER